MVKTVYLILAANVLLLLGVFYVNADLQWRSAYAASPHDACGGICSYRPSFSYSLLTQIFTMSGGPLTLNSPITLDWVQVLALLLVAMDGWFAYGLIMARRRSSQAPKAPPSL